MRERDQANRILPIRRRAGAALAITGAALLSISQFLVPSSAQAAVNAETSADEGPGLGEGESFEEPLEEGALVVEEDEGGAVGMAGLSFKQIQICRAQIRAVAQEWSVNPAHQGRVNRPDGSPMYNPPVAGNANKPGDKVKPWIGKIIRATGFVRQNKSVMGISTSDGGFSFNNEDWQKPPAKVVEYRGTPGPGNRMPVTISNLEGLRQLVNVVCGTKRPFYIRNRVPDAGPRN